MCLIKRTNTVTYEFKILPIYHQHRPILHLSEFEVLIYANMYSKPQRYRKFLFYIKFLKKNKIVF